MRTLLKNQQPMKYALLLGTFPIYERDENGEIIYYTDGEGNKIPLETGESETRYSTPVEFAASISMSGGEAEAVEYGIDVSGYDATVITERGDLPITETSLVWYDSEVGYTDASETAPDPFTADYKVIAVKPSLNFTKYLLRRVTK